MRPVVSVDSCLGGRLLMSPKAFCSFISNVHYVAEDRAVFLFALASAPVMLLHWDSSHVIQLTWGFETVQVSKFKLQTCVKCGLWF